MKVPSSLDGVTEMADLPRALRRLGSVGCLACHGPSALPEAEARWSILRSDVCAHCHDAPPRYGHVVAWQTTSMSRADRDARARSDVACTPCHTTWGFLDAMGPSRERASNEVPLRAPPPGVGAVGISCPACHAVHETAADSPPRRRLLRAPRLATMFDDVPAEAREKSATCIACHAPRDGAPDQPHRQRAPTDVEVLSYASAAALWAGRGGVDPDTGTALRGPSPHLAVEGGCVGCHTGGPDGIDHGKSHGFRAERKGCTSCHDRSHDDAWAEERARIEKEARDLWRELLDLGALSPMKSASGGATSGPPHATITVAPTAIPALGRAAHDLSLLLEDRGFLAHNLPYARLLLQNAKQPIERAARRLGHPLGGADR